MVIEPLKIPPAGTSMTVAGRHCVYQGHRLHQRKNGTWTHVHLFTTACRSKEPCLHPAEFMFPAGDHPELCAFFMTHPDSYPTAHAYAMCDKHKAERDESQRVLKLIKKTKRELQSTRKPTEKRGRMVLSDLQVREVRDAVPQMVELLGVSKAEAIRRVAQQYAVKPRLVEAIIYNERRTVPAAQSRVLPKLEDLI